MKDIVKHKYFEHFFIVISCVLFVGIILIGSWLAFPTKLNSGKVIESHNSNVKQSHKSKPVSSKEKLPVVQNVIEPDYTLPSI
ncbi:MAG: hypothetical protein WCK26_03450 [Candidatus Saccharibacteria bacterium]